MSSAVFPQTFVFRAFSQSGSLAPLAGGMLYFYAAGTTTPQAAYTDPTGTIPCANPLVLDANGAATFCLLTGQNYKISLTDSNGVVQDGYPVDNIVPDDALNQLASTATGKGAALVSYLAPVTGAVVRTLQQVIGDFPVSVKWFGAVGDGGADDTAAIVAAAAASKSVYFPNGTYLFTPPINIDVVGTNFIGESRTKTILKPTATAQPAFVFGSGAGLSASSMRISDMRIEGNATCTNCFELGLISPYTYAISMIFERVDVTGFSAAGASAFVLGNSWWLAIRDCLIENNYHGITVPEGAQVTTVLVDTNTKIRYCTGAAFYATTPVPYAGGVNNTFLDFIQFRDVDFSYNAQECIKSTVRKSHILLDHCYFEQNNTALPACALVNVTGDATTPDIYQKAFVELTNCRTDVPLNSGWDLSTDATQVIINGGYGWLSGTATPIVTTANSTLKLICTRLNTSADALAIARLLLGSVLVYDKNPSDGLYRTYASNGNLFEGHIGAYQPTAPTIAANGGLGSGGTAALSATSTDTAGQMQLTFGASGWTSGAVATVTFAKAYNRAPNVIVCGGSTKAGTEVSVNGPSVQSTVNGFTLYFATAESASGLAYWNYMVIE